MKKKVSFTRDDEDELSRVERQPVFDDEIRELEKTVAKKNSKDKATTKEGGSSSSSSSSSSAAITSPPRSKSVKREASISPETLRYGESEKLTKEQKLDKRIEENYQVAIAKGVKIENYPTYGAWKLILGSKRDPYESQMVMRKLPVNKQTTIPQMINQILAFDKK